MTQIKNFIGGDFVDPASGEYLDNVDPSIGQVYSQVADSDERDVERAVEAASSAFEAWSNTPTMERSRIMMAIADLVDKNLDRLARAECVDNGKPLTLARSLDIPRAATNFRFFASTIQHLRSECYPIEGVGLNYTLRRPQGVAGIISPWNLPLYVFTWKIAPAIATGNTVVAKPSEVTPMTAYLFCELCKEAGLPAGVLNVVHGLGTKAGAAIVRHPKIPTISFTGGTVTGREIAATASPMFKKVGLELGGKNPNVIFADADMNAVIEGSIRSSFANQGQVCLSGSRMFVERGAYDSVVDRLVRAARELTVGDPLEEDTDQGALVSKVQHDKVLGYIELALADGGRIHCGGGVPESLPDRCKNGYFVEPTVITGLPPDCRVNQEEIFGPVVTITPFDSEDEAVALANCTDYGLSASVWTSDVSRAHRVAERIHSGTVWVNCWMLRDLRAPFGGMKSSGVGREGGDESLRFFTEPKNVCIRIPKA
ncbi:MAG: aldehyde dehydrogenase [Planctomycetes bacterium]|nr:aldehyde dehydrogenase [Planctomycetota bacterium]